MPRGKKKEIKNMTIDEIQERLKDCIFFLEQLQTKMKDINPQIKQIRDLVGFNTNDHSNYDRIPSTNYTNTNPHEYNNSELENPEDIPPEIKALLPKPESNPPIGQEATGSSYTPVNNTPASGFDSAGIDFNTLKQIEPDQPIGED